MTVGEKIQQLRKASGISQEQLAAQLNVSRQSVSKWERNDAVPDIQKIVMLSELFSISTDELLKDSPSGGEQGESREPPQPTVAQVVKMNLANKQITMGFRTVITGLIMLVLEFLFLPVLGMIQKAHVHGNGYYTEFIEYAAYPPMPAVFTITAGIIITGICFVLIGHSAKRRHTGT